MPHPAKKVVNLATELRTGIHFGVFIDDTGSPGLNTHGISKERKSWVAVVIKPSDVPEIMDGVPNALAYLKKLGVNNAEFHFSDIWAGKNAFDNLPLKYRLAIFEFMVHIFNRYGILALVQTFDPPQAQRIQAAAKWPEMFGPLRTSNHEDLALIFLLLRVRMYLQDNVGARASACVIVDEGRLAHGSSIVLPGLAPTFHEGAVFFGRSRDIHPIQLADFAAFAMNRWQLLSVKEKLTELDKTLLDVLTPLSSTFLNLERIAVADVAELGTLAQAVRARVALHDG